MLPTAGSLVSCADDCLWARYDGRLVHGPELLSAMLDDLGIGHVTAAARRLRAHMDFIEAVYRHADDRGHGLSVVLGVHSRLAFHDASPIHDAAAIAQRHAVPLPVHRRQLDTSSDILNWCSRANPYERSICGDVKSQKACGSCWAFAATDLIETALSMTTGSTPVALSTQQLLSCSKGTQVHTFAYCFANTGNVPSWLASSKQWSAVNDACGGGMTQNALTDAATKIRNLAPRLNWPYTDANRSNASCIAVPDSGAAAHIRGWEPALDASSCANTSDPAALLKNALQLGPIAVAMNAQGTAFASYNGGVYKCPDIVNSSMIDHALLLVGHGSGSDGDYWILKNSYGTQWGINGFMHLRTDSMLNCGLNVFPVRVLGASVGAAVPIIDGGGSLDFAGLSFVVWAIVLGVVTALTTIATAVGVHVAIKRRANLHRC
ncbi:cysteine protease family C01A [Achlya hypogyna]|uniref:Cysteine protease family C01A n=1 Tax=Achlya hypogyna TaxID=1202772 RepID=A0A1V9YQI2_ACHHY|nr:cysteine protease family C01A [Achlya hypogyna]